MLNLFRQNTIVAGILTIVIAFLLRLPEFISPHTYSFIQTAPFSRIFFAFYDSIPETQFWSVVTATLLVASQAMLINYIVVRHGILYKDTYLPGLMFVVLSSFYPQQAELTPHLVANLFIMLLFLRLCYLYESPNPLLLVFDAGLYLAIALLFDYDLSIFLPFILISVVIFTSFNPRYLLVSLLGIAVPLYFTVSFFYLTDNVDELIVYVRQSFEKTMLKPAISEYEFLLPYIVVVPVAFFSTVNLQQHFFRNKVKTRRILQCIGLMFLFGVLGLFIENTNFVYALYYLNIPLCIVMAYFFISDKKYLLKEAIFLLLIMFNFYFNFL